VGPSLNGLRAFTFTASISYSSRDMHLRSLLMLGECTVQILAERGPDLLLDSPGNSTGSGIEGLSDALKKRS
jgi:hypothetical protein